ncbi:MAG: hypothetical protein LBP62_06390 [Clostridiales bacterium]|nr:hypothetical protein [Clostridiales bacterium]
MERIGLIKRRILTVILLKVFERGCGGKLFSKSFPPHFKKKIISKSFPPHFKKKIISKSFPPHFKKKIISKSFSRINKNKKTKNKKYQKFFP